MQNRVTVFLSGAFLVFGMQTGSAMAEDIQAFMNSNGKVVFTNLIDSAPSPAPVVSAAAATRALLANPLDTLVESISTNHGVDPALVRAVIKTESNFNRYAVSNKGAMGLMQLIPSTGRRYGVRDFFDPEQNIDGGVRHLKFLLQKFNGNLDLSLAAYNAGENLVQRLGRIPSIPETTDYVRKVRANYMKSTPVVVAPPVPAPVTTVAAPAPEPPTIYKRVDARGVVHFSNIEPPN